MSTTTSASQIHELLKKTTPFKPPIIRENDVWNGESFPDLEKLNSHASDAVLNSIDKIKQGEYEAISILITSSSSSGKSHLISRLRRKIKEKDSCLFLLVWIINDLNNPNASFQSFLAKSLSQEGHTPGITQWQELAADIFNTVWKSGKIGYQSSKNIVDIFNYKISKDKIEASIQKTTDNYCKLNRDICDPDVVKAILWTLIEDKKLHVIKWLGGQELASYKSNELRLPATNDCFPTILEILKIIACHKELIICFDELDTIGIDDNGLYRASVVVGLIKSLYESLHKGVIVTCIDELAWKNIVNKQIPRAAYQKASTYGNPIKLRPLDEDLCIDLLQLYLSDFYRKNDIIPPNPIYPFVEEQVRDFGRSRPLVRDFLKWCIEWIEKFNQQSGEIIVDITSNTQEAFEGELESVNDQILDDESLISTVLFSEFKSLIGQTIEGVTIESVEEKVISQGKGKKDKYINFKIIGTDEGKPTAIAVCVAQTDNGKTLAAALKRLVNPEDYKIKMTRGCLVRSSLKQITGYNKNTYLIPLTEQLGGEFVGLKFEEIKPLIALHRVYQKRETDYDLTETEIQDFIKEKGREFLLREHNPLIQEILSDPSGQAPDLEMEPEVPVDTPVNDELTNGDGEDIENFFSA
jgi:hypothetical protein